MTIHEAITELDALKHNTFTNSEKISWLSKLDGRIRCHVMDTHEGGPEEPFSCYTHLTPGDTVLLVPFPHEDIYVRYLEAMVDYHNGEIEKYNNSAALFEAAHRSFQRHYNRTHLPKGQKWKFQ